MRSGAGVLMESCSSAGDGGLGAARQHQQRRKLKRESIGVHTCFMLDRESEYLVAIGLLLDSASLHASTAVNHFAFLPGLGSLVDSVSDIRPGVLVDVTAEIPQLEAV